MGRNKQPLDQALQPVIDKVTSIRDSLKRAEDSGDDVHGSLLSSYVEHLSTAIDLLQQIQQVATEEQ